MNHVAVGAVPKGGPLWESCKLMRLSGSYKNGTVHEDYVIMHGPVLIL